MKIKIFDNPVKVITVLEIGKKWLKLVQTEKEKSLNRVCSLEAVDISSFSEKEIIDKVAGFKHKYNIDSQNLLICLPYDMATVKNLHLPSTSPAEIEDMVDLQVGKQTPYSSDEIIKDYYISKSYTGGYSRVLLVIVHRDIIQRYLRIVEAAGLDVDRIGFSSEGFLEWGRFVCAEAIFIDKAGVLINIDYDTIDFEVVAENDIIFSRNFSLGSDQFSVSNQDWQEKFTEEITRSIYAYQNQVTDKEVGKIVISATKFAKQKINPELLEEKIGLPVEVVDQLDRVKKTEQVLDSYNKWSEKNLSFAGLIGSSFIFSKQELDFIPQELKIERSFKERGRDIYRIGVISAFILLLLSGLFLVRLYNKERYSAQLETRISEISDKTQKLSNMLAKVQAVRERMQTRGFSLDLIYEVHNAVLAEIYLSTLVFDGKENLVLRGNSSSMSEVFVFVNKLEESEYFKNVKARHTERREVQGKESVSFEILCPLSKEYRSLEDHKL
jgi:Tfp pilus assembly PilM family ATPase/Tfp pilus assembly protein PilN